MIFSPRIKVVPTALALAAIAITATAQQRAPAVGASPITLPGDEAKDGRRAVMRETLQRQYTEPEMDEYRRSIDGYERGKSGVYQQSAKVVRRRVSVNLSPDADVPEIRLNAENVGALVFTDSLGAPWPVADVVTPGFVTVSRHENMVIFKPAIIQRQGMGVPERFGRGSVTVLLAGLTSTVTFSLSYGLSSEVDGQVEAQVQARNPHAAISAVQGGGIETDEEFGLFLDGEPPRGANKLKTSNRTVDAWIYKGRLYVRTQLSIHSPAFRMYSGSSTGTNVYRFDRIPSVINAIHDGAIITVGIGD